MIIKMRRKRRKAEGEDAEEKNKSGFNDEIRRSDFENRLVFSVGTNLGILALWKGTLLAGSLGLINSP